MPEFFLICSNFLEVRSFFYIIYITGLIFIIIGIGFILLFFFLYRFFNFISIESLIKKIILVTNPCVIRNSRNARNFFCFNLVLQLGQTMFSSSLVSSKGFEQAGHINPSKAIYFSKNQGWKYIFSSNTLQGF